MSVDPNTQPVPYGPAPQYAPGHHAPEPVTVATPPSGGFGKLLVPLLIGAAISTTIGVYGNVHTPTNFAVNVAGFSSPQTVKVWLATIAGALALVQLFSALVIYGKIPGITGGKVIGALHRWSGRAAFLVTIPVALHCLYALGFQTYDTRVMVHSLLGTFFFGVFGTKMLILPKKGVPGWALPLIGGAVFTALIGLWLTSSLWFFTTSGIKF